MREGGIGYCVEARTYMERSSGFSIDGIANSEIDRLQVMLDLLWAEIRPVIS